MSTFVVRFVRTIPETFRGRVRHVRSGEEEAFSSVMGLLSFFERMNATYHEESDQGPLAESAVGDSEEAPAPPTTAPSGRRPKRTSPG